MRPVNHVMAAGICAIPYYVLTGSGTSAALFAVAAVAIDIDHLVDYILWNRRPLSIAGFFERGSLLKGKYLIFFLHSYEWMLVLYILSWLIGSPELFAVTNGFFMHLLFDELSNRLPPVSARINAPFYFIIYRIMMGFRIEKMSKSHA